VFRDVTRVEFHPLASVGRTKPHVMVLWTWNADIEREEKIVHTYVHISDQDPRYNVNGLRFFKRYVDSSAGLSTADNGWRVIVNLWDQELGWAITRNEIDNGPFIEAEYWLLATNPRWRPPLAEAAPQAEPLPAEEGVEQQTVPQAEPQAEQQAEPAALPQAAAPPSNCRQLSCPPCTCRRTPARQWHLPRLRTAA
jgi:hypothetical protein